MTNEPGTDRSQLPAGNFYPQPLERQTRQDGLGTNHLLLTILLVTLAFTAGWFGNSLLNGAPSSARPYASTIWQAWDDIDKYYVDQKAVDHTKITYAMIRAMVDTLGDTGHSRFLTPAEAKDLNNQINNNGFVGIGVVLQTQQAPDGSTIIMIGYTLPDSPAYKSGLLPGDQIVAVDGKDVTKLTTDQLRPLIIGKEGTTVAITVRRPSDGQLHTFTMARATLKAQLVYYSYLSDSKIGYIQLTGFDNGATVELTKDLKALQQMGATSFILDLRGNPGGLVNEALGVAADFLPKDATVVYEKDSSGNLTPDKAGDGLHLNVPMAILVDNGTASAAEIVTGAIEDNRATVPVVGQRTFGTDTVLETFDLPDHSQILLGVRQFLTPNKRQFKPGTGLDPTQAVALPDKSFPLSPAVLQELHLTEADVLAGKTFSNDTQLIAAIKALQTPGTGK